MLRQKRRWISLALVFFLTAGLAGGCLAEGGAGSVDTGSAGSASAGEPVSSAEESSEAPAEAAPVAVLSVEYPVDRIGSQAGKAIRETARRFGVRTAADLLDPGSNSLYSPISLFYALAAVEEGAGGETREQMRTFLGADGVEDFAAQCGKLFRYLSTEVEDKEYQYTLRLANSLWMRKDLQFGAEYMEDVRKNLYASLYLADFASPATAREIGRWIADNTGGLLAYEDELPADTILDIINTIWVKGSWTDSFREEATADAPFIRADGSSVEVPFMHRYERGAEAYGGENFIRAELGIYGIGKMVFVLPNEGVSLAELLSDEAALEEALHGGTEQFVNIQWSVPRFKNKSKMDLMPYLKGNIPDAFDPAADFSRIYPEAYISGVRQNACISWDEKGVEAAAYTEIMMEKASMSMEGELEFRLDRPFLYALETSEGLDLFIGTCCDPA